MVENKPDNITMPQFYLGFMWHYWLIYVQIGHNHVHSTKSTHNNSNFIDGHNLVECHVSAI